MKKSILTIFLALILVVSVACGKKDVEIDPGSLGEKLVQEINFTDEMIHVHDDMIDSIYPMDFDKSKLVYISGAAKAEELSIFEFDSQEDADRGLEEIQARLESQKETFSSYNPKEVQKLENAIVKRLGNYIILCVSEDDKAEEIINNSLK